MTYLIALITRSPVPKRRFVTLLLTLLLPVPASSYSAPADAMHTVRGFYQWYLQALTRHQDPMLDTDALTAHGIAPALVDQLYGDDHSESDGSEVDYFLQSHHLPTHAARHIQTQLEASDGALDTTVTVILGEGFPDALHVDLHHYRDGWKIEEVRP